MVKRRKTHRKTPMVSSKSDDSNSWVIFDWISIIVFAIMLLVGGISALIGPTKNSSSENISNLSDNAIILQLFNGSGDIGAVAVISDSLRSRGIDIRSEIKKTKTVYPYTLLLNRKGNDARIDSLANMLKLTNDRVILQKNNDIFDATLVIGRDYKIALAKLFSSRK